MANSPNFSSILDFAHLFAHSNGLSRKSVKVKAQTKLVYAERFFLYTWERLLETG
jgi:endonuclease IV